MAVWHIQRQIKHGTIRLPDDDVTPPSSRPPSNYASPHSPPPIPFRPTAPRSPPTSIPLSTHSQDLSDPSTRRKVDRPQQAVRFAKSPPGPMTISLPPPEDFAIPDDQQNRTLTLAGLAFAAASGTLSGLSLVIAKAAVELLVISIDHYRTGKGENQFARAQSWLLVAGLGIGAVLQLVYLNYSLTFASPALICPLAFCFFNLSSIFGESCFTPKVKLIVQMAWCFTIK